jgi:hypothetical protein
MLGAKSIVQSVKVVARKLHRFNQNRYFKWTQRLLLSLQYRFVHYYQDLIVAMRWNLPLCCDVQTGARAPQIQVTNDYRCFFFF